MRTWLGDRHNQIKLLFFVLMILLGARLFYLTVVQGQVWAERAENLSTKTVYTSAPRERSETDTADCWRATR